MIKNETIILLIFIFAIIILIEGLFFYKIKEYFIATICVILSILILIFCIYMYKIHEQNISNDVQYDNTKYKDTNMLLLVFFIIVIVVSIAAVIIFVIMQMNKRHTDNMGIGNYGDNAAPILLPVIRPINPANRFSPIIGPQQLDNLVSNILKIYQIGYYTLTFEINRKKQTISFLKICNDFVEMCHNMNIAHQIWLRFAWNEAFGKELFTSFCILISSFYFPQYRPMPQHIQNLINLTKKQSKQQVQQLLPQQQQQAQQLPPQQQQQPQQQPPQSPQFKLIEDNNYNTIFNWLRTRVQTTQSFFVMVLSISAAIQYVEHNNSYIYFYQFITHKNETNPIETINYSNIDENIRGFQPMFDVYLHEINYDNLRDIVNCFNKLWPNITKTSKITILQSFYNNILS